MAPDPSPMTSAPVVLFLDGLFAFFMLWMGIVGFRRGLIEEVGRLAGLVIAALTAMQYYVDVAGWIINRVTLDGWIALVLSFTLVFVAVLLAVRLVTRMIHYLLVSRGVKWMNQSVGFVFGVLKGGVIIALCVWIIDVSPMDRWSDILRQRSRIVATSTDVRTKIIKFFGWNDPVEKGELFLHKFIPDNRQPTPK